MRRLALAAVAGLTTVALVVLDAAARRHALHATDRGIRLLDRLRDAARM